MTDAQLIFGILQNDERAWRHICREMKAGFASILGQTFTSDRISNEDIEDIFQESLVVLMQKVKSGSVVCSREGALFSYLVQIGKLTACNMIRKNRAENYHFWLERGNVQRPDYSKAQYGRPLPILTYKFTIAEP